MKILSVSTATNFLTVSVSEDEQILAELEEQDQRNHSEHLDPMIDQILKQTKIPLQEIDRFAVAIGPGSYTGLRIGITTMKMFASILNKEVVPISTLAALSQNNEDKTALTLAALDARNDNYFAGAYLAKENLIADGHYHFDKLFAKLKEVVHQKQIKKLVVLGSSLAKHQSEIEQLPCEVEFGTDTANQIHAHQIALLALDAITVAPDQLVPTYLRRTQAEMDWHEKTGKPFEPDSNYVEEV
ncbi:tRNA (adenosine(37)-N6)-threonylcarbamoyltransferase complex dimerization subunit type 1 TsaB [Lactobacillus psittaci]|uniref:Gcp-like domain-containing protein n=1 Tax=Lactobacillus psittaci DSM 15354 TaxID=1122152 RepID=A0A0R1S1K1_9LACO|nr:tRNA (adenosine(37)-N6)-threonylcarbamoyltransferase complex dimerization subunit type 1 TsaB [Lactobacillus psittaci]KRL63094.1 hypothetical protein FC23_GL001033 [Lactobacillus psittaci DSM 15354]